MDKAVLLADVLRRNALRRQAQLPLLDVRAELEHACMVAQLQDYRAFQDAHKDVLDRIRADVLAELRQRYGPEFPDGFGSRLMLAIRVDERFARYAQTQGMRKPSHGRNAVSYGGR